MSWSDDRLSAYLDGELPPEEMEQLARDMVSDKALAARLERLSAANRAFLAAASGIDSVPLAHRTRALLAGEKGEKSAHVVPFLPRRIGAFMMEHRAIAAGLVCAAAVYGLSVSTLPGQGAGIPAASGVIAANSPLHQALEETASGEIVRFAGGAIRPQLTFLTANDVYCRQYALTSAGGDVEGIACRGDEDWRLQVASFASGRARPDDYQAAASGRSAAMEAFIDANIAGAPLNKEAETALLARGWRQR